LTVWGMGGGAPVHPVQRTSASPLEPVLDGAQGDLKLESHSSQGDALTDSSNQRSACCCNRKFSFWQDTRGRASGPDLLAASFRLASLASTPRPKGLSGSKVICLPTAE
jgi:hypothetical protein